MGMLYLQDKAGGGLLSMNFHKDLLSMSLEVHHWERMRRGIPYIAMEIQAQKEKYRVLRENVLMVVRDYNKILMALDKEEKKLFHDRIRYLDRRIVPGITKLTWTSDKHSLEYYYKEARKFCKDVDVIVTAFKAANHKIETQCQLVAENLLISVEKKKVYSLAEFEERQSLHHAQVKKFFEHSYAEIKNTMAATYKFFESDTEEVQREWVRFTKMIDKKMENALRHTVKKSLQELSRVLNGDNKTEVVPIFHVMMVLEKSNRVELRPTIQALFDMIHNVSRELITAISCVPRLAVQLSPRQQAEFQEQGQGLPKPLPSFYEVISNDEDTTLKTIVQITTGITSIVDKVQQFLNYWERKYKHLWDQDKDAYIRRYEKAQKPLTSFISDITKYLDLQEEVLAEDATTNMRFLRIDCGPLKQALVGHCEAWTSRFTGLLHSLADTELNAIHDYFRSSTEALARSPTNLDQLAEGVNLQRRLVEEKHSVTARFEPLRERYRALERFEVSVPDDRLALLEEIEPAWARFQGMLDEASATLEKSKENFREKVKHMVDAFAKDVSTAREEFSKAAPYTNDNFTIDTAFQFIESAKDGVKDARKKAADLKAGMDIFRIPQPPYKDLGATEKDLQVLEKIWGVAKEWQTSYIGWKDGKFKDIQVEAMEASAIAIGKTIVKLGREIKSWPVWAWMKDTVEAFKRTMPLITDLRNEAMRDRHWSQIMETVGSKFDPFADDFTLDSIVKLQLDQHADFISELSTNATKELAIEQSIQAISEVWAELHLDMAEYKQTCKLRSTEDVFASLEDNAVTLSTMKASRFFVVFEKDITHWEQLLSLVSEMIEIVLQVQRNWMYLENIFIGSEDIQKQLPQESLLFEEVHQTFMASMKKLRDASLVTAACSLPGILETFSDMDAKLEKIQKSLENYLESKRQQFPRFYFLSSDDLLEILGQAKDPMNVQSHLKKCFEGIKKLEMHLPGTDGRMNYESTGVFSPDGEYLPFVAPILTEGRPEEWLNSAEAAMFQTTKKHLYKALEDSKSMKKEKWVKDTQGQLIITAGQILWTSECEKALQDADAAKKALRQLKKKWLSYLSKLTTVTRSRLSKIERNKVVSLITIEVHARDVIEKLGKVGCSSTADFDWVGQLRFYWDKDKNDCIVKQVLSVFVYGYEYQGNNGRLVMTPLTDRCYMTLGAALFTRRGGNPLGPAGTGKTET
ncbi:unnamed protein product, partial [Ostreobium quekettii]